MKRLITYSGIILLLLTGCVDKSYKGVLSEMLADEELPVQIIIGDPGDILESKGSGALEDSDPTVWEGKTIHIYAFKRDINSDYSVSDKSSLMVSVAFSFLASITFAYICVVRTLV